MNRVFDYRALRLLMGVIAIILAPTVSQIAGDTLPSVSASYHSDGRDVFVGMLLIVGSFLWAYNGKTTKEALASKGACISAICVAIFPTDCLIPQCVAGPYSTFHWSISPTVHWLAASTLFVILAYFCFGPFRENTKGQPGKRGRRSKIYFACGSVMVGSMLVALISKILATAAKLEGLNVTYWVEAVALTAFGVAWIVSGKVIRALTDDDQLLHILRR